MALTDILAVAPVAMVVPIPQVKVKTPLATHWTDTTNLNQSAVLGDAAGCCSKFGFIGLPQGLKIRFNHVIEWNFDGQPIYKINTPKQPVQPKKSPGIPTWTQTPFYSPVAHAHHTLPQDGITKSMLWMQIYSFFLSPPNCSEHGIWTYGQMDKSNLPLLYSNTQYLNK